MKRQLHKDGSRDWYAQDLLDLQAEPFKIIDGFFSEFGSYVLSGCALEEISDEKIVIGSGIVVFCGTTGDGEVIRQVASFPGQVIEDSDEEPAIYWVPVKSVITGDYLNSVAHLPVAIEYKVECTSKEPISGPYINLIDYVLDRADFISAIQAGDDYKLVAESEKRKWNAKPSREDCQVLISAACEETQAYANNEISKINGVKDVYDTVVTNWDEFYSLRNNTSAKNVLIAGDIKVIKSVRLSPNIKSLTGSENASISFSSSNGYLSTYNYTCEGTSYTLTRIEGLEHLCSLDNLTFKFNYDTSVTNPAGYDPDCLCGFTNIRNCKFSIEKTDATPWIFVSINSIINCSRFDSCRFELNWETPIYTSALISMVGCKFFSECHFIGMNASRPEIRTRLYHFINCYFDNVHVVGDYLTNCLINKSTISSGKELLNCITVN